MNGDWSSFFGALLDPSRGLGAQQGGLQNLFCYQLDRSSQSDADGFGLSALVGVRDAQIQGEAASAGLGTDRLLGREANLNDIPGQFSREYREMMSRHKFIPAPPEPTFDNWIMTGDGETYGEFLERTFNL